MLRLHALQCRLKLVEQGRSFGQQLGAGLRQRDLAAIAVQLTQVQLYFEFAHLLRHGRCTDP